MVGRWVGAGLLGLLSLAAPPVVGAQPASGTVVEAAKAAAGKEVRLTRLNGLEQTGTFVSMSDSAVVVRIYGADRTFPLSEVKKVERISRGVRKGALLGGLASVPIFWIPVATGGGGGDGDVVHRVRPAAAQSRHRAGGAVRGCRWRR